MSMQMDAEYQKEQNGPLGGWVGARGGGEWGGGGARAPKIKNRVDVQYFFFWRLLGAVAKIFIVQSDEQRGCHTPLLLHPPARPCPPTGKSGPG